MHPRTLPAGLLAALLCALAAGCASGGSAPTRDPETVKREEGEAADLFGRAEALRAAEEWDDARGTYRDLFEDYPGSRFAPEAQYQAAECAFRAGRLYAAGELFAKYIEDRPLSPHIQEVEGRLFEIGRRLVEDGKRGLWGMGFFTTSEEGVHVLRKMVTLLPTGTRADDALMEAGRWYASERDFPGAEAVLDELVKNYPGSEWRLEARFLLAWTYWTENRGPAYDGEKLRRSRAHFSAYIEQASSTPARAAEYGERIAAAKAQVGEIDARLAEKALLRARFYRRTGKNLAALTVLREASRRWGSTEPGAECTSRAESLAGELGITPPEAAAPAPEEAPQ
jgi:outer membrane protein assembly factor BamD (BamD/ComL family)